MRDLNAFIAKTIAQQINIKKTPVIFNLGSLLKIFLRIMLKQTICRITIPAVKGKTIWQNIFQKRK